MIRDDGEARERSALSCDRPITTEVGDVSDEVSLDLTRTDLTPISNLEYLLDLSVLKKALNDPDALVPHDRQAVLPSYWLDRIDTLDHILRTHQRSDRSPPRSRTHHIRRVCPHSISARSSHQQYTCGTH